MFRITGLDPAPFRPLFALSEAALAAEGIPSMIADKPIGFPDRISLHDAAIGDRVLLINHCHQPDGTAYRSRHAIYINEAATAAFDGLDTVPQCLRPRILSLRAFDARHDIIDADLVEGSEVERLIETQLANPRTAYIHAHFAKRGCFAARIDRG